MNSSGKVLAIFVVIIAILLISLTAISLFFFQKETERRKLAEATLEEFQSERTKLEEQLNEAKKQNFLLQEKNKEADGRINDLSDELELEKGLREEMKIETVALKKQIEEANATKQGLAGEIKAKEEVQERLTADIEVSNQKIKELEAQLEAERERTKKLGQLYEQNQEKMTELEKAASVAQEAANKNSSYGAISQEPKDYALEGNSDNGRLTSLGVELGEIVVVPGETIDAEEIPDIQEDVLTGEPTVAFDRSKEGRILSVDIETEFVIISLGGMDGIDVGDILSVYRNDNYLGDIKITRLQPEMSAADLVPPLSVKSVKKNDQVKAK